MPINAPLAPNAAPNSGSVAANSPERKYANKNRFVPIFCSINEPNINSAYILKNK